MSSRIESYGDRGSVVLGEACIGAGRDISVQCETPVSHLAPGLFLVVLLVACPAAASAEADIDGPGRYYVFRTLDSGDPPTAEQDASCDAHFGPRAALARVRLNARLFGFRVDPLTSRLVDQAASVLGPGFICGAPVAGRDDVFEAYAYAALPGAGTGEATGTCGVQPAIGQPGADYFTCRLALRPDPTTGAAGGLLTSNSIVNPGNAVPGTPTGSVWTAYVVGRPGAASPTPPQEPGQAPEGDVPGADFYVMRAFETGTPPSSPVCGPATATIRTATLSSVEPDIASGLIPEDARYVPVGALTVCYGGTDGHRRPATAAVQLGAPSDPLTVTAQGECRETATPAGDRLRQQSCSLAVPVDLGEGVRGGMITSNGLVSAEEPTASVNAAVWTISIFGGSVRPVAEPPSTRTLTVTRVRVSVRRGRNRLHVRWRPAGARPASYDVDVRYLPARRWRRILRATTRQTLGLRRRGNRDVEVRVRARQSDGTPGAWAKARVR